jgi:hypothetical protein
MDTVFGETRVSKLNLDRRDAGGGDICIIGVAEYILINKFG